MTRYLASIQQIVLSEVDVHCSQCPPCGQTGWYRVQEPLQVERRAPGKVRSEVNGQSWLVLENTTSFTNREIYTSSQFI